MTSEKETVSGIKLSILIPTLPERYASFVRLKCELEKQQFVTETYQSVEILHDSHPTKTIGDKRQSLINRSRGEYFVFIDDDDKVHENYIELIMKGIKHSPDVIGIVGRYYVDGVYQKPFVHSINNGTDATGNPYWEDEKQYYRCPNHLNPMRREHANEAYFMSSNFGEDTDWAMQIYRKGVLKTEYMIEEPIYYYFYKKKK